MPTLAGAGVVAETDVVEEAYIAVPFGSECNLHRSLGLGRCYGWLVLFYCSACPVGGVRRLLWRQVCAEAGFDGGHFRGICIF